MARPTLGGGQWWTDVRWRNGFRVQRHALSGSYRLLDPKDRQLAQGGLLECELAMPDGSTPEHLVLLLHGLGRRSKSLHGLGHVLREDGHAVAAIDYASTRRPLEEHAAALNGLVANLRGTTDISLVTHSMGGIVARRALSVGWPERIRARRLMMLAPPSRGAQLAARLNSAPFRAVMGPAAVELAEGAHVPLPSIPFAVIAGSMRGGRGLNPLLTGDDDGIVSVEETRLEGALAHHVIPSLHTTIMNHPEAQRITREFLRP